MVVDRVVGLRGATAALWINMFARLTFGCRGYIIKDVPVCVTGFVVERPSICFSP